MTDEQMQQFDPQYAREMAEMQQEQQEDMSEEVGEEQFWQGKELQEAYGAPEPEEKQNAHTFLHKAAFGDIDTTRSTFLSESELGRPLFSVRFMLKMEDVAKYYLDDMCKYLKLNNKLAEYFHEDIKNTTDSGLSNRGIALNLNVTRRMDATKKRIRVSPEKGGLKDEN